MRRDSFEEQVAGQVKEWEGLVKNYQPGSQRNPVSQEIWQEYPKLEEQDIEFLIYLVENAYWDETFTDIYYIIREEAGSFWSGDKIAKEIARIIQNRIQLYLDELRGRFRKSDQFSYFLKRLKNNIAESGSKKCLTFSCPILLYYFRGLL